MGHTPRGEEARLKRQNARWARRSGEAISYTVEEEKPELPPPPDESTKQYIRRAKGSGGWVDPNKGRSSKRTRKRATLDPKRRNCTKCWTVHAGECQPLVN